jgi:hypothetical protein
MRKHILLFVMGFSAVATSRAQADRWQQRVKYTMDINMDVTTNKFTGKQKLEYTNNSPDTLKRVFYHLYWNAFQPGSMMDVRSREMGTNSPTKRPDWDPRVKDRIAHLKPDETGYQKVLSLTLNGEKQQYIMHETILEVVLSKPILPRSKVVLDMNFETQVPLQIRRAGRDNPATGVRYSMSQWYPKLCEYDYEGWHADPYIAREFYGIWGDYDVNITIDKNYTIGGTGYLLNAQQIGHGYEAPGTKVAATAGNTLTWKFTAPNVHDFMWAADPEYKHISRQIQNGPVIHVLYKSGDAFLKEQYNRLNETAKQNNFQGKYENYVKDYEARWTTVADAAVTVLPFIESKFGAYPYKQYSFVHGGDGGMEYPMATLVVSSSLGTAFHEWMHSWYQGVLATNESEYAWMDEGFTSYAESLVSEYYRGVTKSVVEQGATGTGPRKKNIDQNYRRADIFNGDDNPHSDAYEGYINLAKSRFEEPLTTHADHFETNYGYSVAAYSKGEVFMEQLGYIVGEPIRDRILHAYYNTWKFKHPNVNDFIRVAEKESNMQLDWYREYFVNTTKTINYKIDSIWSEGKGTKVRLRRVGYFPMPIDLMATYKDGSKHLAYIPMYLMFGAKENEYSKASFTKHEPWRWTNPTYEVLIDKPLTEITSLEIDPTKRLADIDRNDNKLEFKW